MCVGRAVSTRTRRVLTQPRKYGAPAPSQAPRTPAGMHRPCPPELSFWQYEWVDLAGCGGKRQVCAGGRWRCGAGGLASGLAQTAGSLDVLEGEADPLERERGLDVLD